MNRIRVALFNDRAAAEPIRQHLLRAGIPAELHDELGLASLWFVSKSSAGVRVEVPARLSEMARQLLLAREAAEGALRAAIRCPECGSLRVDYPQFTRKSLFTNLAIGLIARLGLVEKDYYCEDCHYAWPKQHSRPLRARAHLAPNYFIEDFPRNPVEAHKTQLSTSECRKTPPAKSASPAAKPARFHLRKIGRKTLAVPLAGAMLLLGSSAGFAGSSSPVSTADTVAKTSLNSPTAAGNHGSAPPASPTYLRDVLPILMGKCARCHSDQTSVLHNWLDYQTAFGDRWEIQRRVWHSWKGSYFKQPMPTGNSPESQAMTDEERALIRDWVAKGAPRGVAPAYNAVQSKAERIEIGRRLFSTICAACHQPTGRGIPSRFPPLAGSDFLNADKHRAIKIVVNGLQGEVLVNGQRFNNSMPKFPLGDQDIANVLTYVYSSFGNSGKEVTPPEVSAVRVEKVETVPNQQYRTAASQETSPFE
ncbi:MAG TPA: c-type cytochrome [Candidatus Binatia bacterium]|jgi:mono/diheme cytochrome c family protein|nr:c-type cytochrome [Candidatus Binatia bacterium]